MLHNQVIGEVILDNTTTLIEDRISVGAAPHILVTFDNERDCPFYFTSATDPEKFVID